MSDSYIYGIKYEKKRERDEKMYESEEKIYESEEKISKVRLQSKGYKIRYHGKGLQDKVTR